MKQFKPLVFTVLILLLMQSCKTDKQEEPTVNTIHKANTIEVIDFYGTHRCITCKAIEANARYTLKSYFINELNSGKISFKTVNVDNQKNYKIAEDYEATGTALFLNIIKDGKETHIDLTNFAFENGRDQEAFSKELKSKIETELKKL